MSFHQNSKNIACRGKRVLKTSNFTQKRNKKQNPFLIEETKYQLPLEELITPSIVYFIIL